MKIDPKNSYKFLVRPVIVVSTISKNGISNAAPFSFNSPISFSPPIFGFSCNPQHDTWKNIKENNEFVVNIVGEDFGPLMSILERDFPYEVSEIEKAGLTTQKSTKVRPPRIKEAYAWLECRMMDNREIGDHIWISGEVIEAEIKDEFFDDVIDIEKSRPLSHISGKFFGVNPRRVEYKRG